MKKVIMLAATVLVTGMFSFSCSSQKGSSGHTAGTTRPNKHYWKYHGK